MSKTTETKTAAKTNSVAEAANKATDVANKIVDSKQVNAVFNMFGALATAGRKSVEGVIEIDKTLIEYSKDYVNRVAALGSDTVKAKCFNDVIDLQASFAHNSVETAAANTREIIEMARTSSKEAYAPVKEVIDGYRNKSEAAA